MFALAMVFVGFLLPVTSFWLTRSFIAEKANADRLTNLSSLADNAAHQLQLAAKNGEFWCHQLNHSFSLSKNAFEFEQSLRKLAEKHEQKISWILWNKKNRVLAKTLASRHPDKIWEKVGAIMRRTAKTWFLELSTKEDSFIRAVLGEHMQTKTHQQATFKTNPALNELSFFRPAGSFWADFNSNYGAMVVFPTGIEQKNQGIKAFIKSFAPENTQIAIIKDGFFFSSRPGLTRDQVINMRRDFSTRAPVIHQDATSFHTGRYIGENLFFCIFSDKFNYRSPMRDTMLFAIFTAFIWALILAEVQHGRLKAAVSIKYVVGGIITCSNLLPLLILGILGHQYLEQKRQVLIEERRVDAINFLKQVEAEFVAETHKIKNFAIDNIQQLGKVIEKEPLSIENTVEFRKKMESVAGKFMIVASNTYPTISDVAFLGKEWSALLAEDGQEPKKLVEGTDVNHLDRIKLNQTMCKCGAAFIAFFNGTTLAEQVLTEVELIIEAIFQTKIGATFHRFLKLLDRVENLGMGSEKHPTFMHFLSFNPENFADYLFMFHFNLGIHARNFMSAKNSLLQGNYHGFKVVYAPDNTLKNLKLGQFSEQQQFRNLFSRQTYFPQPSAELIKLSGKTWIATGFISRIISDISLVALCPVEEIDRALGQERQQLLATMLINILLVAGITLLFVQTLLKPVSLLQAGTEAIRHRDFAFRIPELGKDEFGKMSRVFNSALADLEEMSLARDVQQQLFPRQQIETGQYDLFSKTLTMADLGGDYLDVIQLDPDRFIMILGDVAGHGVGAAMIMAMAKSAMLNSNDVLDKPTELMARLHSLIYRTKTKKQKKIMTLQYIMVNIREHTVTYSNAGGCNPFVVRASGSIEEISLPGVALGSFKNSKFNSCEINLEQGDSLVLYTDGLVESRNDSGEELGYDRFKDMLLENHCDGSQHYYDRIMLANKLWRQNQPPQDDFSLMILGRSQAVSSPEAANSKEEV